MLAWRSVSAWDDTGTIPPATLRRRRAHGGAGPDEEIEEILVGDRRMRVRRRRPPRLRINPWIVVGVVVVLAVAGLGFYLYRDRPEGLQAVEGPLVAAPGGFQAKVEADGTITVALEIRNMSDEPVTVVSARVVPPAGLRTTAVSVLAPGEQNRNLTLTGDLPPSTPVTLGTSGVDRNAIVAARFRVECADVPATATTSGERVFVTVRLGTDQREEELTPPVVDGLPWLAATARTACGHMSPGGEGPAPSSGAEVPTPLPPLPSEP